MRFCEKENKAFAEVRRIYEELDGRLARRNFTCKACGRCCDLEHLGQELWASEVEVKYILFNAGPPKVPGGGGCCPYLSGRLCGVYPFRTLGCRTYFCEKAFAVEAQEICQETYRQLKKVAEELVLGWTYRPFLQGLDRILKAAKPNHDST